MLSTIIPEHVSSHLWASRLNTCHRSAKRRSFSSQSRQVRCLLRIFYPSAFYRNFSTSTRQGQGRPCLNLFFVLLLSQPHQSVVFLKLSGQSSMIHPTVQGRRGFTFQWPFSLIVVFSGIGRCSVVTENTSISLTTKAHKKSLGTNSDAHLKYSQNKPWIAS